MLGSLEKQTYLPDEVIVALSESSQKSAADMEARYSNYSFPVRIIAFDERQFPGQNRNRGARAAKYDIVVFCDADDEYHPQKMEITQDVFLKYGPKMFLHNYKINDPKFDVYDRTNIPLVLSEQLFANTFGQPPKRENSNFIFTDRPAEDRWVMGSHPTHGYAAVRRDVFDNISYCDLRIAEDLKFCLDILWEFKSAIYADVSLINYCYKKRQ